MTPAFVELPPFVRGDTWSGIQIGPITFDNVAPTNALVSCRLHFRDKANKLGYGFSSISTVGYGIIVITDANTWEISIAEQSLPLEAGTWTWDFETTDSLGITKTYIRGNIKISEDRTY
jgi:hypothetical protein